MERPAEPERAYAVRKYSEVEDAPPKWLWYPYMPFGMITLVYGMPSSGKSTLLSDIIASVTSGNMLPDGSKLDSKINAVYQCAEAGGAGTIRKMLENAGADLDAVSFVDGDSLTMCDGRIQRIVEETGAKLLVIDPMQEFLEANMSQAQSSRKELSDIARMAENTGCAVVFVSHFTKTENKEEIYQGMGSADIAAIARSILHVRRIDRLSSVRYMSQVKCNIAPEGGDYAFEIVDLGAAKWIGPVDRSEMDEINDEAKSKRGVKQIAAIKDLRELLKDGDLEANVALEKMKNMGHSVGTVRAIKEEAGVKSNKLSDGPWVWHLL